MWTSLKKLIFTCINNFNAVGDINQTSLMGKDVNESSILD